MPDNLLPLLESLYEKYNRREYVSPDPLQFLYNYNNFHNIEIVGIIASSLAYGNVKIILKNVGIILSTMENPYHYILNSDYTTMKKDFKNFKHRFSSGEEIANLLFSLKKIIDLEGSLYNLFFKFYKKEEDIFYAVKEVFGKYFFNCPSLIPNPDKGSPCKRIFLFLRWMIRKDNVDLGIWKNISKSKLIVPLDTHLLKISRMLNLTNKKNSSMKTALEITENFSKINKNDPVKYDFVLTRFGIRKMGLDFFKNYG